MFSHVYAGRLVRSAFLLLELDTANGDPSSDVWCTVELGDARRRTSRPPSDGATFDVLRDETSVHMVFEGLAEFVINPALNKVVVHPWAAASDAAVRHLLIDHVLPRLLDAQGVLTLHASGVRIDDEVVLFLGQSGDGKSSLAASLAEQHQVLGDDCFFLEFAGDALQAQSTYASLRLNPDSAQELLPTYTADATVMATGGSKMRIVEAGTIIEAAPAPVRALFVLNTSNRVDAEISVLPMSARDASIHLLRNSFRIDVLDAMAIAAAFDRAEYVAQRCPIYQLSYPHDYTVLPEVHKAILSVL